MNSAGWLFAAIASAGLGVVAQYFPYDTDAPQSAEEIEKTRKYYADAYTPPSSGPEKAPTEYETRYLQVAKQAAETFDIEGQVKRFAEQYRLQRGAVLEIGSGRGYLQDVAENYTGLDISSNVARFYHKKFVQGSATAMPFADDSFDGAWSIWVLEHVPNPEHALTEIRRVMRDGGVVFLSPAWDCTPWAAEGYDVRPFSDFGLRGKLIKASLPIRTHPLFAITERVSNRALRSLASRMGGPTKFRYRKLEPNYKVYWQPDSDAVNRLDRYEAMLWFRSRGDECLSCDGDMGNVWMPSAPLVVRIHKSSGEPR